MPGSFTLTRTVTKTSNGQTGLFNYPAATLTSFSVTVNGGIVSSLSFTTSLQDQATGRFAGFLPNSFTVAGGSNGVFDYFTSNSNARFTQGTITAIDVTPSSSAVPLPPTAFAGSALLAATALLRRARRAA